MTDGEDGEQSLEDRFSGYPLATAAVQKVRAYQAALDEAEPANDEETAKLVRWKARTERAFRALETVDPVLAEGPLVTQLGNNAEAATAPLEVGISQPNTDQTADSLFNAIVQLASLPPGGVEARPLSHVTDPATELVRRLTERVATLEQAINGLREARDELVGDFNTKLETADSTVADTVERLDDRVEKAIEGVVRQVDDDREAFSKAAEDHDNEAERLLSQLRRKLAIAADESLSAGYGNSAHDEQTAADTLRTWAIGAAVTATIFAVAAVLLVGQGGEWANAANLPTKVAAIGAPAAIAIYLSKQSNVHRHEAWRLRQVQLELTNLGEYVSELSEEQRALVRRVLVARYFGSNEPRVDGEAAFAPMGQTILGYLGFDGARPNTQDSQAGKPPPAA